MTIKLHFSVIGLDGETGQVPSVVLLHGLFGMGSNLGALARSLAENFRVYSVDLPNHGRSQWLDFADIPTMANAVKHWMASAGLTRAHIMGHSLGGKVAMELALRYPSWVDRLCIADIAPVHYLPGHEQVFSALQAVAKSECHSRADAGKIMEDYLEEEMIIQFLLMSIRRDAQGIYRWRFNLQGLIDNYEAIRAGIEAGEPFRSEVLFVKGGDSSYILPEHQSTILNLFPHASVKLMPGCGHWLHVQQPRLFNSIVKRFLLAAR